MVVLWTRHLRRRMVLVDGTQLPDERVVLELLRVRRAVSTRVLARAVPLRDVTCEHVTALDEIPDLRHGRRDVGAASVVFRPPTTEAGVGRRGTSGGAGDGIPALLVRLAEHLAAGTDGGAPL